MQNTGLARPTPRILQDCLRLQRAVYTDCWQHCIASAQHLEYCVLYAAFLGRLMVHKQSRPLLRALNTSTILQHYEQDKTEEWSLKGFEDAFARQDWKVHCIHIHALCGGS